MHSKDTGSVAEEGASLALMRHADGNDVVAVRAGQAISLREFLRDVAGLVARLPDRAHIVNLCTDRYRFMVGFAAALCRGQISLLPPSTAPEVLKALADDHPDVYALSDAIEAPLPMLAYPDRLDGGDPGAGVPAFPAVQRALVLFTSGSTGRPKPVPKSWGALVRSARAAGDRLGVRRLGDGATVIGTVPHQHSYGLESTILLALQHGLAVAASGLFYPGDIRAAIEAAAGARILVTTPVHLRTLVAEPGGMPRVDLILSATAPLPMALAEAAEACFAAPLIEIYGCTEAGQVATRRTVHEAHWHCFDGIDLREDKDGCWASGPAVEGTALLYDTIQQTGPGIFLLGDRPADLVDVAGKRTSLAHLNHHLLSVEGVCDGVFFMPDADGRSVARLAAIAVAPGLPPEAILRALRDRIDPVFLPRPLVMIDVLPRNALGKLPRETLLRLIGREPRS